MKFLNADHPVLHIEIGARRLLINAGVNEDTGIPSLNFWWADRPSLKSGPGCTWEDDTRFIPMAGMTFPGDIEPFRSNLFQLLGNLMQEIYIFHERMDTMEDEQP